MTSGEHTLGDRRLLPLRRRATWRAMLRPARTAHGHVVRAVGGPARARVIALFGAVLALNTADASTIGAVAPQLEHSLHIGNTKIALLSSVTLLTGAVFVVPVGLLVDRFRRIPLLSASIVLWSVASLASTVAANFGQLLLTRLALGAVTATAGPAVASLTGDYFPTRERGRIYAYILAGEVGGTAVGFILCGTLASAISWRAAFALLALPGFLLAWTLWRSVPEPLRGGHSRLDEGVEDLEDAVAKARTRVAAGALGVDEQNPSPADELAHEKVKQEGITPDLRLVLGEDPERMGLRGAMRYTLRIPTNVVLVVSSALGYFFFFGLETFALLFIRGHYHASQATAELVLALLVVGALIGTLIAGRLTDALLRRGVLGARVYVPGFCYVAAAVVLVPGIVIGSLGAAIAFDIAGAALISAANPGLDAARLDIMPARLWGRAESARTLLRSLAEAAAPLAFGGVAALAAGVAPAQTPVGTHTGIVSPATARGLEISFLLMLTTLIAAGALLFRGGKTYLRDVATAAASDQAQSSKPSDHESPPQT